MGADLGGTELKQPLDKIFSNKVPVGRGRQVFVLTDGQVSNTDQVIETCRRNAANSRVFSVGIGDEVSRHLVEGMARGTSGTAEFIQGVELNASGGALERKLLNQLKLATQPAITKILIEWGTLGKVDPPEGIPTSISEAPAVSASSTPTGTIPPRVTFQVNASLLPGEALFVVGSLPQLGGWSATNAVQLTAVPAASGSLLGMFGVGGGVAAPSTEYRSVEIVVPAGPVEFKFIKRQSGDVVVWESFDGNRIANVDRPSLLECGTWSANSVQVLPLASTPASAPAPAPAPSASMISSGGPMRSSVPVGAPSIQGGGARPVSKFFQTGGRTYNPNAVGSGPALHAPSHLAPAVSAYNDASSAQALGRNDSFYQAPFLPPPIFSGARFVMYAYFQPGACPTGSIRLTAEGPDGDLQIDIPITKLATAGRTLHTLAARALIRDLEEGTSHLHWRKTSVAPQKRAGGGEEHHWFRGWLGHTRRAVGGKGQDRGSAWSLEPVTPPAQVVRQEIIELGTRYGLTSSQTSFVAVETWLDGRSGSSSVPNAPLSQQPTPSLREQEAQQQQSQPFQMMSGFGGGGGGGRGGLSMSRSSSLAKSKKMSNSAPAPRMMAAPGAPPSPRGPPPPPAAYGAPMAPMASASSSYDAFSAPPMEELRSRKVSPQRKKEAQKDKGGFEKMKESFARKPAQFAADNYSSDGDDEEEVAAGDTSSVQSNGHVAILLLQSFDGSFSPSPALWAALGRALPAVPSQLAALPQAEAEKVLSTIAVLAALERQHSASRDLWEMSAEKASNWCLTALARLGLDRGQARKLLAQLIASV